MARRTRDTRLGRAADYLSLLGESATSAALGSAKTMYRKAKDIL